MEVKDGSETYFCDILLSNSIPKPYPLGKTYKCLLVPIPTRKIK